MVDWQRILLKILSASCTVYNNFTVTKMSFLLGCQGKMFATRARGTVKIPGSLITTMNLYSTQRPWSYNATAVFPEKYFILISLVQIFYSLLGPVIGPLNSQSMEVSVLIPFKLYSAHLSLRQRFQLWIRWKIPCGRSSFCFCCPSAVRSSWPSVLPSELKVFVSWHPPLMAAQICILRKTHPILVLLLQQDAT